MTSTSGRRWSSWAPTERAIVRPARRSRRRSAPQRIISDGRGAEEPSQRDRGERSQRHVVIHHLAQLVERHRGPARARSRASRRFDQVHPVEPVRADGPPVVPVTGVTRRRRRFVGVGSIAQLQPTAAADHGVPRRRGRAGPGRSAPPIGHGPPSRGAQHGHAGAVSGAGDGEIRSIGGQTSGRAHLGTLTHLAPSQLHCLSTEDRYVVQLRHPRFDQAATAVSRASITVCWSSGSGRGTGAARAARRRPPRWRGRPRRRCRDRAPASA